TAGTYFQVVIDKTSFDGGYALFRMFPKEEANDRVTSDAALTGSGDANAVVHFTVDGIPVADTVTADAAGNWTYTPVGLTRWRPHDRGERDRCGRKYRYGVTDLHARHRCARGNREPG